MEMLREEALLFSNRDPLDSEPTWVPQFHGEFVVILLEKISKGNGLKEYGPM